MACKHWKDDWVAHLYGELASAEEQELVQHLEDCAGCRETLEGLSVKRGGQASGRRSPLRSARKGLGGY